MANIENRPPGASAAVSTINHLQTAAEMLQTWCQVWLHVSCPQSLENPDIQSNPGKLKFWPIRDTVFKLYDWSIHQISRESSFLNLALGGDRYQIQLFLINNNPLTECIWWSSKNHPILVCVSSTPCGFQILAAVNGMSGVDGKIWFFSLPINGDYYKMQFFLDQLTLFL